MEKKMVKYLRAVLCVTGGFRMSIYSFDFISVYLNNDVKDATCKLICYFCFCSVNSILCISIGFSSLVPQMAQVWNVFCTARLASISLIFSFCFFLVCSIYVHRICLPRLGNGLIIKSKLNSIDRFTVSFFHYWKFTVFWLF